MSNLTVDTRNVLSLLSDPKNSFLIPDYQRPYAWTRDECETLWEDLQAFCFPNDNLDEFNIGEEYFLGPIVTFENERKQLEIIDGQQRLTTLMLLLRAFKPRFEGSQDAKTRSTKERIESCIWKQDEYGTIDSEQLKIDSEVASDNDKDEFIQILTSGVVTPEMNSKYAINYRFFLECIQEFSDKYPSYIADFPTRIMNSVILLPIEADSQDTALRIFSTLNDRGLPLSDADIFKSQMYKYFSNIGKKDEFIKRWKDLEDDCNSVFSSARSNPTDELFTRYMYYERAKQGNKKSTTEALRNFFEKDNYALLKKEETLCILEALLDFWKKINQQDSEYFSERNLKRLFVLKYAPNGMWSNLLSVYFIHNRDENNNLDEEQLFNFLSRITVFIWAYAIERPGVNALRTPVYTELINLVNGQDITFENFKFDKESVVNGFMNYKFTNGRPLTKSMLAWWAYNDESQPLLGLDEKFDIEHIYAKRRSVKDGNISEKSLESLGNKVFLEKRINISASDYRFADKKRYYSGEFSKASSRDKKPTEIVELHRLSSTHDDFTEEDIIQRKQLMIDTFIDQLDKMNLLK